MSEGRYRGSDLAVTAGELNAGAGVERLGIEIFDRRVADERLLVGSGQLTN